MNLRLDIYSLLIDIPKEILLFPFLIRGIILDQLKADLMQPYHRRIYLRLHKTSSFNLLQQSSSRDL